MNEARERTTWHKKPNKKVAIVVFSLFSLAIATQAYWQEIQPQIEALLQSEKTRIFAAIYCVVAVATKSIFFEKEKNLTYRFFEFLFGATGYSSAAASSINLIGAAYSNFFGNGKTFKDLAILDTASIIISSSILLIYCAVVCTHMLRDALFLNNAESVITTETRG